MPTIGNATIRSARLLDLACFTAEMFSPRISKVNKSIGAHIGQTIAHSHFYKERGSLVSSQNYARRTTRVVLRAYGIARVPVQRIHEHVATGTLLGMLRPKKRARVWHVKFHDLHEREINDASGKTDELKGRVKEAAGALTGNKELKREGKADQAVGKIKQKAEKVIDKIKDAVG
jgi:uncharacterized protein YjbJ (UPF0337 family)